jgi:hypothetical protein
VTTTRPTLPPGALLATDAATADRPAGPCALCQHAILTGHRFARLLSGRLAHTACIGSGAVRWRPVGEDIDSRVVTQRRT